MRRNLINFLIAFVIVGTTATASYTVQHWLNNGANGIKTAKEVQITGSTDNGTTKVLVLKDSGAATVLDVTTDGELDLAHEGDVSNPTIAMGANSDVGFYRDNTIDGLGVGVNTSNVALLQEDDSNVFATDLNAPSFNSYVGNSGVEAVFTGWTEYDDAAAVPVDCTGSSDANFTPVRSASSPLSGIASILLQFNAADTQGAGLAYPIVIDTKDMAQQLVVEFDYDFSNANYDDGDLAVYIYDVDAATLIYPINPSINGGKGKFSTQFQTSASSDDYRVCIHRTDSDAVAMGDLKIDNVYVGRKDVVEGVVVTEWEDFPSVAAGTLITGTTTDPAYGTVTVNNARWRRVGQDMEIEWDFTQTTTGTGGEGAYLFNLPAGYTIDTTNITVDTGIAVNAEMQNSVVGTWYAHYADATAPSHGVGSVIPYSSTQLKVLSHFVTTTAAADTRIWGAVIADSGYNFNLATAPLSFSLRAKVPISGWTVNEISSSTSVVAMSAQRSTSNQTITFGANRTVEFNEEKYDTHAAYDGTSTFTVPSTGFYRVDGQLSVLVGATPPNYVRILVNDVAMLYHDDLTASKNPALAYNYVAKFNKGDTIVTKIFSDAQDVSIYTGGSWMNITKIDSPASQVNPLKIENGTSKVEIASADGDISLTANGTEALAIDSAISNYVFIRDATNGNGGVIGFDNHGGTTAGAYIYKGGSNQFTIENVTAGAANYFVNSGGEFIFSNGSQTPISIATTGVVTFGDIASASYGSWVTLTKQGGGDAGYVLVDNTGAIQHTNTTSGADIWMSLTGGGSLFVYDQTTPSRQGNVSFGCATTVSAGSAAAYQDSVNCPTTYGQTYVRGGGCYSDNTNSYIYRSYTSGNNWICNYTNATSTVTAYVICCYQ